MRAIIADAGNTRVAFAAWTEGDAMPRYQDGGWRSVRALGVLANLPTPHEAADEAAFAAAAAGILKSVGDVPLVLVSVVPRVDALLAGLNGDLVRADHTRPLPFRHLLQDVSATGADRLCNVAAAVAAGLEAAMVVDAGTATTVDVLVDGTFVGGVIAPGMGFALQQIGLRAARLGPAPFAPAPLIAGRDTVSALAAGGFHAGIGGVEALIRGLQSAHGRLPIVLTGGLGRFLTGPGRFLDPDWTMRGAACLAGLV